MARLYRGALAAGPLSPSTRAKRLLEPKLFFAWLCRTGRILLDPFEGIVVLSPRRALPVYLTQGEVKRLLEGAPADERGELRDRALLETLYSSALRISEAVSLELRDVDLSRGLLFVRQGKGRKDRMVPLGRIAARFLERYIKTARMPAPSQARVLFLDDEGRRLGTGVVRNAILPLALESAGIHKHVTPHALRHSCAVHLLENGASVRYVQALLGHARLDTTQKYLLVVPTRLRDVHRASHPAERRETPGPTAPTKWIPSHRKRRGRAATTPKGTSEG